MNHVFELVCDCIYSNYNEMNILSIFGECVVVVCASNLGIERFVFVSHFAHQNDPDYVNNMMYYYYVNNIMMYYD